jgi:hypothetical protein
VYLPGDAVLITDIGMFTDPSNPGTSLVCRTEHINTQCCRGGDGGNVGHWFYPDGSQTPRFGIAPNANFSRSGFTQQVRLNRRNNATSPTGSYECRVPAHGGGNLHTASIQIVIGKQLSKRHNYYNNLHACITEVIV